MSAKDFANKHFICGFAKEKLYLLFILTKHQANPQSTGCLKNNYTVLNKIQNESKTAR